MIADALLLHPDDDVATALRPLAAGESCRVRCGDEVREIRVAEPIGLCHKIAVRALAAGDLIRKYGQTVGEARQGVACGAHVHVHNLRSLRGGGHAEAHAPRSRSID